MFTALSLLATVAPMAVAQRGPPHRGEQWQVFEQRRGGHLLPLREIEDRIVPQMRGADYLGPEYNGDSSIYTLKFVRNGAIFWIFVDGRSGQVLGRKGR